MVFITADGGGTKLSAFAFDEKLNILASAKSGGVNALFMDASDAKKNMESVAEALLCGIEKTLGKVADVDGVYYTIAGNANGFIDALEKYVGIRRSERLSEGQLGILAGTLGQSGLLAVSGTGSDCFLIENGKQVGFIGGWGQYFGDEGSGFDMGRKAINAAIRSYDGRGAKTELETLVFKGLGLEKSLWEVCSIHQRPSFRKDVSGLTKEIETACGHGDEIAMKIVEYAADELALAAVTMMTDKGYSKDDSFIFTTSGGGWKTSSEMTERFIAGVNGKFPRAVFKRPVFEPVAGGAIKFVFDSGDIPDETLLREKLRSYLL